jgi:hypothetical protein
MVHPADREKTAYTTPYRGLFQFLKIGLTSSPGTFERLMVELFIGLVYKTLLIYLDDLMVFAETFEGEIENLREVFTRIREAKMKLKPSKCNLFQKTEFFGQTVSEEGILFYSNYFYSAYFPNNEILRRLT